MTENKQKTKIPQDYVDNIIRSMIDALIVVNAEGIIQMVNQATCNLLGYEEEELLGQPMSRILAEEEEELSLPGFGFDDLIKKGFVRNVEKTYLSKDGRNVPVLFSGSVMRNNNGEVQGIVCVAEDITERKRAEQALQNKNLELEQLKDDLGLKVKERTLELQWANAELSKLNEVKSNFISIVSHELRTPLTAIKSFAEILLDDLEELDIESQKKFLSIINNESDRLDRLISDLLDLQKIDSGKMIWRDEKINFTDIAQAAVDFFSVAFKEKGLALSLEAPDKPLIGVADKDKIKQIFSNFLSNALKFTEKGGAKIVLKESDQMIEVSISDTGKGIPHEETVKVFERFYQVDGSGTRQHGGSGLGLNICKEIIEHYQGKIWVESRPGHGSTFFFALPEISVERKKLGEILIESGMLAPNQLSKALKKQKEDSHDKVLQSEDAE